MLSNRQILILRAIIDDFIHTAQAVGSRTLAKKKYISYSPATIRNEMADLEDMGYLEKTHSSSGRVPSEKGYRFYVDHLLSPSKLTEEELQEIQAIFNDKIYELEQLAKQLAQLLSEFTNYTSIVLGPKVFETKLKQLQFIPIQDDRIVAIIVTDTGHVEHRTITVEDGYDPSQLEKLMNILNERLVGVPLIDLKRKVESELTELLRQHMHDYEKIYRLITQTFGQKKGEQIFFGGKTNMLTQPEFNDIEKIRSLLSIIEREDVLYDIVQTNTSSGISIKIGRENKIKEMSDCSLITATYSIGKEHAGTIAILGPTRMEYSRVISLLSLLSDDLSRSLTSLYQNK